MSLVKKKRFWFGLIITGVFLFLVFRQVDYPSLAHALMHADYRWLIPALVVYLFGYLIRAVCWKYLVNSIKPIRWQALLPPLILGFMMNNVLPARIGEIVRAYVVGKREGIPKSSVLATVIMHRAYDGLVMVLLAAVVLYFFKIPRTLANAPFIDMVNTVIDVTTVIFVALFVVLFIIMLWKAPAIRLLQYLTRWLPAKVAERLDRVLQSFMAGFAVMRNWQDSLLVFLFTVAAWSCESAAYYFVLLAFGLALPVYASVMLMAIVNLGIMIPSSPGYIGPFEFFGVGTLRLFMVEKSVALPCILVIHSLVWLPITLWGFYYMWTQQLSFKEMESVNPEITSGDSRHG